jgi:hypothetical protein
MQQFIFSFHFHLTQHVSALYGHRQVSEYRAETCCVKWKWKEKIICCITDRLDIYRLFNMACNRVLKYRILGLIFFVYDTFLLLLYISALCIERERYETSIYCIFDKLTTHYWLVLCMKYIKSDLRSHPTNEITTACVTLKTTIEAMNWRTIWKCAAANIL